MKWVRREAARVLLIDESDSVLLFRGGDPENAAAGEWWFTPGGGLEAGESIREAALREVLEETGLVGLTLGEPIAERTARFEFSGNSFEQHEIYFLARVSRFVPARNGWTELELRSVYDHRWWSVDEIEATSDVVYPENLAALLREHG